MKHIEDIRALLDILLSSGSFHSLILEGAPGWGKSSTVENLFRQKGTPFVALGSYTTPLSLFKFLSENPQANVVIDDCAGIFGDAIAMSILKAATWPSSGSEGTRLISWGTTSEKGEPPFFFDGKIVLLTNMVPKSGDGAAFTSRSLHYCIAPGPIEMEGLLRSVASSPSFPDSDLAREVADVLIDHARAANFQGINLRTLRLGYELAQSKMDNWRELFQRVLPAPDPFRIAYLSTANGGTVEEQFKLFHRATGLSRRTFFYYRSRDQQLK
jgi:hypothetical protein